MNVGIDAAVVSISCAAPGNCAAGGYFTDAGQAQHGFVVDEHAGSWGSAQTEVAPVTAVSCSAGDCAAVGSDGNEAFVVDETAGAWGAPQQVPGLTALAQGGQEGTMTVSCAGAGACAAGGTYAVPLATYPYGTWHGFVVDQVHGSWGGAQEVPGLATLNAGGSASVITVSCADAGTCAAGGTYTDTNGHEQGFVADESVGSWAAAQEVPGLGALNAAGSAQVTSISCASASNCAAGGTFATGGSPKGVTDSQGFVADETGGAWGKAQDVPGLRRLNHGDAVVESVSCGAVGNCAAGGYYSGTPVFPQHSFIANESRGRWEPTQDVPGVSALRTPGIDGGVKSISCPAASHCSAVGEYQPFSGPAADKSFVASEPSKPTYCSPNPWLTGAGLSATVTSRQVVGGDLVYRVVYTNRSPTVCALAGIPGALGISTERRLPVGPPATRTGVKGRGGTIYLDPLGGRAQTTFVIHVSRAMRTTSCRPELINGILIRPKGVPEMFVPLHRANGTAPLVCRGLRNEAIYGFGSVTHPRT